MSTHNKLLPSFAKWLRPIAVAATAFGALTLFSGGSVLFGPMSAQTAAGSYVPFVVWFNFIAGFAYIAAGLGIWTGAAWARALATLIVGATVVIFLGLGLHIAMGGAFEMRTVGALIFRAGVWAAIVAALGRAHR
ncbi:hypothetical protein [Parasedimentitalea psychrophila]|uniref:Uncharacterized protein n=1 Tax=Parasedimentitalea psychrophila TaxID=2997337 RepID=A0A9Y2KZU1_9RHOB|nr:hypothetical protein [Parasedimentitalea psychrophila]WIY24772.1 hypothetical protein QPJ95_20010 [Parasedimentitalea psychrophila]